MFIYLFIYFLNYDIPCKDSFLMKRSVFINGNRKILLEFNCRGKEKRISEVKVRSFMRLFFFFYLKIRDERAEIFHYASRHYY